MEAKPKNSPWAGLVDHDLLVILVDDGDPDHARDHDVGLSGGVADLPDTLARGKGLHFDLAGQHGRFVVIEQGKQRYLTQDFWCTSHLNSSESRAVLEKATPNDYHKNQFSVYR